MIEHLLACGAAGARLGMPAVRAMLCRGAKGPCAPVARVTVEPPLAAAAAAAVVECDQDLPCRVPHLYVAACGLLFPPCLPALPSPVPV